MLDRFVWFKQSAFLWRGEGLNVYIDPWGVTVADPADVIFITHAHGDHYSMEDIERIRKADTKFVAPRDVARELSGDVRAVAPGDSVEIAGIRAEAVPAYNIVEERLQSHPKKNGWVGYVLRLGGETYYHAGDSDHLPELDSITAGATFLPVSGSPYTMSPSEAADLAKAISPQVAVPMHFGFFEAAGTPANAEQFAREAAPIKVEILKPENPFDFE